MSHDGFELPQSGFTFWNVGTGDSTVVSIDEEHVVLVDIRHLESAEDDDDPRIPIIDYLVDNLPRRDGHPYLATFVLTHPDEDHCQGFAELIERVHVGELWFAPRVLDEYDDDLCDDAQAFVDEVHKRIGAIAAEGLKSGNRLRIIGSSDVLDEPPYDKIPQDLVTVPGNTISLVNGDDVSGSFEAFIHAPFKEDAEAERNDTSVGMRVSLYYGSDRLQALLLGDLSNPTLNRIFDVSAPDSEPPRECWRLQSLRGWSDDTTRQIPSGDPRAGGPDGVRARAGPLVAVGNDQLDRLEVRDDAGDVTEVGATG